MTSPGEQQTPPPPYIPRTIGPKADPTEARHEEDVVSTLCEELRLELTPWRRGFFDAAWDSDFFDQRPLAPRELAAELTSGRFPAILTVLEMQDITDSMRPRLAAEIGSAAGWDAPRFAEAIRGRWSPIPMDPPPASRLETRLTELEEEFAEFRAQVWARFAAMSNLASALSEMAFQADVELNAIANRETVYAE